MAARCRSYAPPDFRIGSRPSLSGCISAGEEHFPPDPRVSPGATTLFATLILATSPENAPPQRRYMLADHGMLSARCSSCTNIRANAPSNQDQVRQSSIPRMGPYHHRSEQTGRLMFTTFCRFLSKNSRHLLCSRSKTACSPAMEA